MEKAEFAKICKEAGVEVKDLPAFPKRLSDDQWREFIRLIGETKKKYAQKFAQGCEQREVEVSHS